MTEPTVITLKQVDEEGNEVIQEPPKQDPNPKRQTARVGSVREMVTDTIQNLSTSSPDSGEVPFASKVFFLVSLGIAVIIFLVMLASIALPWYTNIQKYTTTITNGRVYTTTYTMDEYLFQFQNETKNEDSDGPTDTATSTSSYGDTIFHKLNSHTITPTLALVSLWIIILFGSIITHLLLVLSSFGKFKVSTKRMLFINHGVFVTGYLLAIIAWFIFFSHPDNYKYDINKAGLTCDIGGPCNSFVSDSKKSTVDLNTKLEVSWGPAVGWVCHLGTLFGALIASVLNSPFLSPAITGVPKVFPCLP